MSDVWTVLKKIFWYYPLNYTAVAVIRIVGFAGLGMLSGLLLKRFFDQAASASGLTEAHLYGIVALLIVVPLVQAFTYSVDLALSYGWTEIIRAIFRRNLYRHVLEQPGAAALPVRHGALMNMLRTDVSMPESVLWSFPYLLGYSIFSLVGFVILSRIDWTATLALFAPLLLALLVVRALKRRIAAYFEGQQINSDRYLGQLTDMFRHHQAIRVNNADGAFLDRLGKLGEERAAAGKRNAVFTVAMESVLDNIVNVGMAILLLVIGYTMQQGGYSAGGFTLYIYFLGYVAQMIRLYGTVTAGLRTTEVSLARIGKLLGDGSVQKLTRYDPLYLDREPPVCPIQTEPFRRLEQAGVHQLEYIYPDTDRGIRDITFSLPRGSFTVIAGPVGSGKTTLLRTMLGLLPKTSGELSWNGEQIDDPADFFIPPVAAYVPQVPVLFSGSLKDNVCLGYPHSEIRLQRALKTAVLEDDLARFPDGLDTLLGAHGMTLSGGQRQRVAIARMAYRQAELWVLDDISSALDSETEILLWERIDAIRQSAGITCLIVSPKPYALRYADQILSLNHGRIDLANSRLHGNF